MLTQKPLSVTRNYFGPRADRLASALPISQGFGNIAELGLGMPVTNPLGGTIALDSKVRNHSGSTIDATWLSDNEGSYIYLPSQSAPDIRAYVSVIDNTTGSDIAYNRGTILIRFSINFLGVQSQHIINFGGSSNITNMLLFFIDKNTRKLEFEHTDENGNVLRLEAPWDSVNPTTATTIIITWGEQGTHLWVDNVKATVSSDSDIASLTGVGAGIPDTKQLRLGRNSVNRYSDMNLYAFCMWDYQLHEVEREELFADPYISFRPRAQDFTGSDAIELFRTDVNPMVGRATQTSATFNVVTDETIASSSDGILDIVPYFRVQYDTSPVLASPTVSSDIFATKEEQPLELVLDGLTAGTTYYWIAQYSSDGLNWYYFPGGKGRFVTQRITGDFTFAVVADDHLTNSSDVDDTQSLYPGFGGDLFRWGDAGNSPSKLFNAWRHNYDIYTRRTPDFILHCGDFIMPDNWTTLSDKKKFAQGWRNWQNLLCKSGAMYFALGNHEGEAGYLQWAQGTVQPLQMEATITRKLFFPNPTNITYPEGGENEGNETSVIGNSWVLPLNTAAPVGDTAFTWSSFNQDYRDDNITNLTKDPLGSNKSPLQNYYAFTWSNSLFVILDIYRYSEVGDVDKNGFDLNLGSHVRKGPTWVIGDIQKAWLQTTLENSNAKYKFIIIHNLSGEQHGINAPTINRYYGRGSGANIKKTIGIGANPGEAGTDPYRNATIYIDGVAVTGQENPEEIALHELYKRNNVTAIFKGHDHRFCHVINEEVNYITCPTGSAPSQWEFGVTRNSYGFDENTDNQPPQAKNFGIQSSRGNRGYVTIDVTSTSCNLSMRFTKFETNSTRDQAISWQSQRGRWAGLIYTPDSSEQIVLSERPHDIYLMTTPDAVVFDKDGFAPITTSFNDFNFYVRPPSYDPWEVFEGDSAITLDGSAIGNTNIVVGHAPAVLYSTDLFNAVVDTDESVELHNLRPEDVVFVYNNNIEGSREVAEYYREKRSLPSQNLIGLDMPPPNAPASCEEPISFTDFINTIYNPLLSFVLGLGGLGSAGELNVAVIILGYGTPLSYTEEDGTVVAIASRLHRLNHGFSAKYPNHTYDRRGSWKFFDADDSTEMSIVAVIDGPTQASAMALIDRAIDVDNQSFVPGKLYIDPYGKKITTNQLTYQSDILDFVSNSASSLSLETVVTTDTSLIDTEPTVNFFSGDSFYWGWFEPTYSKDLFLDGNERRVFLYNADDDSACQIHFWQDGSPFDSNGSDPWCNLAINIDPGYAVTAGAAGANNEYGTNIVGEENYLRPRPFFESLHRGATVGEAFLFATPFVSWKIILIGDPMMTVKFIGDLPADQDLANTLIPNNEMIRQTKDLIEEGLAYGIRQSRLLDELIEKNVSSDNFAEEIRLLYELAEWKDFRNENSYYDAFARLIDAWSTYILQTTGSTVQQWLFREVEKTSEFVNNVLSIDTFYIQPEGLWEYRFVFEYGRFSFEPVHFQLQVATDAGFSDIVVDVNSFDSISGWAYEQNAYTFTQIVSSGLPSNFHGRTIKYTSPGDLYLTRTNVYYVRTRTIEVDGIIAITSYKAGDSTMIVKY